MGNAIYRKLINQSGEYSATEGVLPNEVLPPNNWNVRNGGVNVSVESGSLHGYANPGAEVSVSYYREPSMIFPNDIKQIEMICRHDITGVSGSALRFIIGDGVKILALYFYREGTIAYYSSANIFQTISSGNNFTINFKASAVFDNNYASVYINDILISNIPYASLTSNFLAFPYSYMQNGISFDISTQATAYVNAYIDSVSYIIGGGENKVRVRNLRHKTSVSSEVRARGVWWKSTQLTGYQQWNVGAQSIYPSDIFPYQIRFRQGDYPSYISYLVSQTPIYLGSDTRFLENSGAQPNPAYFSGMWIVYSGGTIVVNQSSSQVYIPNGLNDIYEANHDVYTDNTLTSVYFSKTTTIAQDAGYVETNHRINT